MPAIENLADDSHWRVRLAIIQYIPLLATQLGAESFQSSWSSVPALAGRSGMVCTVEFTRNGGIALHEPKQFGTFRADQYYCTGCCRSFAFVRQQHGTFRSWPLNLGLIGQRTTLSLRSVIDFPILDTIATSHGCGSAWHSTQRDPEGRADLLYCLQVLAMVHNAHYLHRMTILGALAALAPAVAHDTLCNTMLPVFCHAPRTRCLM